MNTRDIGEYRALGCKLKALNPKRKPALGVSWVSGLGLRFSALALLEFRGLGFLVKTFRA